KFWIILSHTYMTRVKTKAFLISTIITLLFIIGLANIQSIIDLFSNDDETKKIAIIDESEEMFTSLKAGVERKTDDLEIIRYDESEESGKDAVKDDYFATLVVLSMNYKLFPESTDYADTIADAC